MFHVLSFVLLILTLSIMITCVKHGEQGGANRFEWRALIGSFASSDSNDERSSPSLVRVRAPEEHVQYQWDSSQTFGEEVARTQPIKRQRLNGFGDISMKPGHSRKQKKSLNELYPPNKLKSMRRQYFLNSKNTPEKLAKVQRQGRERYYRSKVRQAERLAGLPEAEREAENRKKKEHTARKNKASAERLKARMSLIAQPE